MDKKGGQIFYDSAKVRWRRLLRVAALIAGFFLVIFAVTLGSLIIRPVLPTVDLKHPESKYRGVPNVAKVLPGAPSQSGQGASPHNSSTQAQSISEANQSNVGKKIIGFYVNWDSNSLTSLKANIGHLDELIPEWYHLGEENEWLIVNDQVKQDETMAFIKQSRPNLPVVPLINNFNEQTQDWDSARLERMLRDPSSREVLIKNLLAAVQEKGFAGISIDFESVSPAQQANLMAFMRELYAVFHPLGLEVSQNVPLDDDSFDCKEYSRYSDFLIVMAYDEHSVYDTLAGPVASQEWFARSLKKQLALVEAQKIVVAVGGYGYDWEDGKQTGMEVTFQDAIRIAQESEGSIILDAQSLNPTFDYYDDVDVLHHVWYLDAVSAFNQMALAGQLGNVRGYALWRIGSEDPALWNIFDGKSFLSAETADTLQTMQYGYDIINDGSGEIFRVTATPKTGKRILLYDKNAGIIKGENVFEFPSPYVITHWGGESMQKVALTFDDGPDAKYTAKILDILKAENVPATFFIIGVNANANKSLLERMVDEGHELGSHTYTHPNISMISSTQLQLELDATQRLIESVLGRRTVLFRPPYSEDIEPETPDQVQPLGEMDRLGYYTVGMHIDPLDWQKPPAEEIVSRVTNQIQNGVGNIMLLHDAGGNRDQTLKALPQITENLKAQGFQFVGVSNLMGLSRDEVMPKISTKEQWVARANSTAFSLVSLLNNFVYWTFMVGVTLGMARFVFLGIFALAQWLRSRKGSFRLQCVGFAPRVDVIIPAYNEEDVIVKTVNAILHSTYQNYHITIVDDGSSDNTYAAALHAFENNPLVTIYRKENGGKSSALNFGIVRSDREIIITLDADTFFHYDTIEKIIRRFVDERISAVAGNVKVGNRINILTRWQALEYITSQNLDRRAFEMINCITVVPGAVGAWRRSALAEAGGFSSGTLAEDADLTFSILRSGHSIAYDDEALGFTEAPDNVRDFLKQRFRWMFGMLQVSYKHRDTLLRPRFGGVGMFAMPNLLIFQILFPFISPIMDMMFLFSLAWAFWQRHNNQVDFSQMHTFRQAVIFYVLFTLVDLLTATIPFFLERKEQWSLLVWMPLQRFFYRQLMYYVAIKAVMSALSGRLVGWGKFARHSSVDESLETT